MLKTIVNHVKYKQRLVNTNIKVVMKNFTYAVEQVVNNRLINPLLPASDKCGLQLAGFDNYDLRYPIDRKLQDDNNNNDDLFSKFSPMLFAVPKSKKKKLEEIQQQHLRLIEKFDKDNVKKITKKEHDMKNEIKAMRGSDGFLEFEETEAPWKNREGPYKSSYLLDDLNWIFRKSKKADLLIGGGSIAVCCAMGFSVYFSDIPPI
jgi:hypothetical protein